MPKTDDSGAKTDGPDGYIAPYALLRPVIALSKQRDGATKLEMPLEVFAKIFELALKQVGFDEAGYLERNQDVAKAIGSGKLKSALAHYARNGYFEDRPVAPPPLDAAWYLREYPDVGRAIAQRKIKSAAEHWAQNGHAEGRAPSSRLAGEVASWHALLPSKA